MITNEMKTIDVLKHFNHGCRTDAKKRVLNNRDAETIILTHMGPSTFGEIVAIMREWRHGNLRFTYLFNKSFSGGYGCVARDVHQKGWWMSNEHSGIITNQNGPTTDAFFRRTYWFRMTHGMYSLTFEGMKRFTELQSAGAFDF